MPWKYDQRICHRRLIPPDQDDVNHIFMVSAPDQHHSGSFTIHQLRTAADTVLTIIREPDAA